MHSYTNIDHLKYLDAERKRLVINQMMSYIHKKKPMGIEQEPGCKLLKLVIVLQNKVFRNLLSKHRPKHPYNVAGHSLLYLLY